EPEIAVGLDALDERGGADDAGAVLVRDAHLRIAPESHAEKDRVEGPQQGLRRDPIETVTAGGDFDPAADLDSERSDPLDLVEGVAGLQLVGCDAERVE